MWRTVGFLMSFAVVLEGMTLVAYVIILVGGRAKRESGWKVTSFLLLLTGSVQCAAMAIIVRINPRPGHQSTPSRLERTFVVHQPLILTHRFFYSKTINASSSVGNSMSPGSSVPSAGVFSFFLALSSSFPAFYFLPKEVTSLFPPTVENRCPFGILFFSVWVLLGYKFKRTIFLI